MGRRFTTCERGDTSTRPPRYRLMSAAASLPRRAPDHPSVAYERACPACGLSVLFTQVHGPDGIDHLIEDHDCA